MSFFLPNAAEIERFNSAHRSLFSKLLFTVIIQNIPDQRYYASDHLTTDLRGKKFHITSTISM
jgi:hypothetical protein